MSNHKRQNPSRSLRSLGHAELRAVAGGISFLGVEERSIIIYSSPTLGGPDTTPVTQR